MRGEGRIFCQISVPVSHFPENSASAAAEAAVAAAAAAAIVVHGRWPRVALPRGVVVPRGRARESPTSETQSEQRGL